jgi:hypothetical protein
MYLVWDLDPNVIRFFNFFFKLSQQQRHQPSIHVECRQFECLESGKILGLAMHRNEIESNQQDRILFYQLEVQGPPTLRALWLSLQTNSGTKSSNKLVKTKIIYLYSEAKFI